MKIGFYNPYFDSLGGGERYVLSLASYWSKKHKVDVFWDDTTILKKAQMRFALDLSGVTVVPNFFLGNNLFKKLYLSKKYDLIFFLSDGSIPTSLAKRNILHFQVPFAKLYGTSWKLGMYQAIVCNSEFTRQHLDPIAGIKAEVIYPPVVPIRQSLLKKEKIVLSVGRFTSYFQAKKQDIFIEAWAMAHAKGSLSGWKLILAGGLMPNDEAYFNSLKRKALGLPITLIPNITHKDLLLNYQKASVYWHAAGFGESDPTLMEHFGISTVEAMSAGCVPIVYDAGGQKEIISDTRNGYLWNQIDQLLDITTELIENEKLYKNIQKSAALRAGDFSGKKFEEAFDRLLI